MAADRPLLPASFAQAALIEADAPVDSLPCWEAGSVGAGPRIGLARVVTRTREVFSDRSRFEAADLIRPLVSALGVTKGADWHQHLELAETAEREVPQDAASGYARAQGVRVLVEYALRELRQHLHSLDNEFVLLPALPEIPRVAPTVAPAAAPTPAAGTPSPAAGSLAAATPPTIAPVPGVQTPNATGGAGAGAAAGKKAPAAGSGAEPAAKTHTETLRDLTVKAHNDKLRDLLMGNNPNREVNTLIVSWATPKVLLSSSIALESIAAYGSEHNRASARARSTCSVHYASRVR